jgi:DNA-binding NtrC family response regulator
VNILILDDQRSARHALTTLLGSFPETETCEAASLAEARALLASRPVDLALIDIRLNDDPRNRDGLTLVRELRERGDVTAVVVTGSNEMAEIRTAMRCGAYDYVLKEELSEALLTVLVRDVREHRRRARDSQRAPRPLEASTDDLVGASSAMERLRGVIRRVAPSSRPALVTGPTGSGKEPVVRAIHRLGPHPGEPLLDLNCGAIPEQLLESQLFGYEKGAFTGADRRQDGSFTAVGEGTLFLDEVAELPLPLQAKLLRVLETGRFCPVGSQVAKVFRGRVVAATHANLEELVARRAFREDLYYRLNVLAVRVPALDEHREDIPALAAHFAAGTGRELRFTPEALDALQRRSWPGNVRQLRTLVDRLDVFVDDDLITPDALRAVASPEHGAPPRAQSLDEVIDTILSMNLPDKLDAVVAGLVDEAVRRTDGNKSAAARLLGLHRKALDRKLDRQNGPRDGG